LQGDEVSGTAAKDSKGVMPRRARGKGKHSRPNLTKVAPGAMTQPPTQKVVQDLRRVRSEANKLGGGPWSMTRAMDKVVRSAMRHAGDDIRMLVGLGHVHHRDIANSLHSPAAREAASVKSAKQLHAARRGAPTSPKGDVDKAADAFHTKMKDLNALTADVDEVTTSDDLADMRSVDAKLHTLVANLRSRRAAK
jgi:hypothetical protein